MKMTPGTIARAVLGSNFRIVGEIYRRLFVDMGRIVDLFDSYIPSNANILDVGGGDGYVVNLILEMRDDVSVTMTDIASDIGSFVKLKHRDRLILLPNLDVEQIQGQFDVIMLADVIHHVPRPYRSGFLDSVARAAVRTGCKTILVKDIQPGGLRAQLALWSDLYITGDRGVSLLSPDEIAFPGFARTKLEVPDYPNYCMRFALAGECEGRP